MPKTHCDDATNPQRLEYVNSSIDSDGNLINRSDLLHTLCDFIFKKIAEENIITLVVHLLNLIYFSTYFAKLQNFKELEKLILIKNQIKNAKYQENSFYLIRQKSHLNCELLRRLILNNLNWKYKNFKF